MPTGSSGGAVPPPEKWRVIYPAYINSNRTLAEGRRIPRSRAVFDPLVNEIRLVLESKGFQLVIEPQKVYPRELDKELATARGRVRYFPPPSHSDDESISNHRNILLYLAEMIPKLKDRVRKPGQEGGAAGSGAGAGASKGGGGKKKKK